MSGPCSHSMLVPIAKSSSLQRALENAPCATERTAQCDLLCLPGRAALEEGLWACTEYQPRRIVGTRHRQSRGPTADLHHARHSVGAPQHHAQPRVLRAGRLYASGRGSGRDALGGGQPIPGSCGARFMQLDLFGFMAGRKVTRNLTSSLDFDFQQERPL
jgi:hypothetical protein